MSDTVSNSWPTETEEEFAAKQDGVFEAETDADGVATIASCYEAMKAVLDPEIGINVVDLGLIYDISVTDHTAKVLMTLTSMGCPLTELLQQQATLVLTRLPGIHDCEVEFTFSPPWTTDMISDDAKDELRAMGFNV